MRGAARPRRSGGLPELLCSPRKRKVLMPTISDDDEVIVALTQARAGRATVADLMQHTGLSETTVRRRLKTLQETGLVVVEDGAWRLFNPEADAPKPPPPKTGRAARRDSTYEPTSRRREDVAARDEQAYEVIAGERGIRVEDVAARLGVEKSLAYGSIWRLSHAQPPRIVKITGHLWIVAT